MLRNLELKNEKFLGGKILKKEKMEIGSEDGERERSQKIKI